MRTLAACVLVAAMACASFSLDTAPQSVMQMVGAGSCTAWAAAPGRWITAKHCLQIAQDWRIDGVASTPLAVSAEHDIALIAGPPGSKYLRMADAAPPIGATVSTLGYGLGKGVTLLAFPAVVLAQSSSFFGEPHGDFLVGGANGMPGMSGGPILYRGRVVSMITGGGPAPSAAHLVGSGVPWAALAAFVRAHVRP